MLPQRNAKLLGISSFVLFIGQVVCAAFLFIVALTVPGGGHPPGGALLLMFVYIGILWVSPVGFILGVVGRMGQKSTKSLVGMVGNLVLAILAWAPFLLPHLVNMGYYVFRRHS